jgi:hypothetical protein
MWMEVEEGLESSFVVKEFFREDINLCMEREKNNSQIPGFISKVVQFRGLSLKF